MIEIENLEKTFKILNRKEGLKGAVLDLVSRDYKYVKAVDNITMSIDKGEIVGYVGPNGAGKSTTIKMMTGILNPTSGKIIINGIEPYKHRREHTRNIGVVFGQRSQLWWSLPVIESYKVLKDIYKIDNDTYKTNLAMFEDLVHVQDLYNKPVRQLSLGQRMLCEVIAAFLHNPGVVFLDEPTIGLDISVKDNIRTLIRTLNQEKNTTIVLTSHDTSDIEALCNKVVIIDKGQLIFNDDIEQLRQMFGQYRTISLLFDHEDNMDNVLSNLLSTQYDADHFLVSTNEDGWVNIEVNEAKLVLTQVLNYILASVRIKDLKIESEGVESIIKKIYEGKMA